MRREEREGATPSELLERLGEELGRRDLRVTLAPAPFWRGAASDGELVLESGEELILEVINARVPAMQGRRIRWADGAFWWQWEERIDSSVSGAADIVSAALQWSRQLGLAPPRGEPG